jgi:hypothetical protein
LAGKEACLAGLLSTHHPLAHFCKVWRRACSLRVAFVVFFFVVVFFFTAVLFVFFFVWLFSNEDIDGDRAIRMVWAEEFWTYSAHAQWYSVPIGNRSDHEPNGKSWSSRSRAIPLREETILNLGKFHWSRAFFVVVRHVVDPGAYGKAPHQPGIAGLQQFGRRTHIIHSRTEP